MRRTVAASPRFRSIIIAMAAAPTRSSTPWRWDWRLFGGAAARRDLRFIVIFTVALSSVGSTDLMFRSSAGIVLIVVALLTIVGLYVLWHR